MDAAALQRFDAATPDWLDAEQRQGWARMRATLQRDGDRKTELLVPQDADKWYLFVALAAAVIDAQPGVEIEYVGPGGVWARQFLHMLEQRVPGGRLRNRHTYALPT